MTDVEHRPAAADGGDGDGRDPRVVRRAQSRTAAGAGRRRARGRRRHTVAKVIGSTLAGLAVLSAMTVAYGYRHFSDNITHEEVGGKILTPRAKRVIPAGPDGPINVLLMGYDGRDCDGCDIDGIAGAGGSDTTILVHISGDRSRAYGISIPRDSIVDRPECEDDDGEVHDGATHVMWNVAYAVAGEQCVISQVEQTTGVFVDNYITVNFASFKGMVDALDGVEVCIPQDIDDPEHNVHLKAGTRKISGDEALTYVRVRYDIGDQSDLGRTRRQQAFISSMISQAMSTDTLTHFWKLVKFIDAATKGLTTDFDGPQAMAAIAQQLRSIGLDKIQFITVPTVYGTGADKGRVFWTDQATELWDDIVNDQPLSDELTKDAISVENVPNKTSSPSAGATDTATDEPTDEPTTSAPPASLTPSGSSSPSVGADGLTDDQRKAYEDVGLCT